MPYSVFITDPDSSAGQALKTNLERAGFEVTLFADGDAAINKAREHRPDLVIFADEIAGSSGFALCNRLKRTSGMASLPVFILVAKGNSGAAEAHRSSRSPAVAYLDRSPDASALLEQLRPLFPDVDSARSAEAPPPLPPPTAAPPPLPRAPPPRAPGTTIPPSAKGGSDPFGEPPESRLPSTASTDERLLYFRERVKSKDESLARARQLYAEKEAELSAARRAGDAQAMELADLRRELSDRGDVAGIREIASRTALTKKEETLRKETERSTELTVALAARTAELETAAAALATEREKLATLAVELADEKGRAGALSGDVTALEAELARSAAELASRDDAEAGLRTELTRIDADVQRQKVRLAEETTSRVLLEGELATAGDLLRQAEERCASAEARHVSEQEARAQLESERSELLSRLDEAESRAEVLTRQNQALVLDVERLEEQGVELAEQIDTLHDENRRVEASAAESERDRKELATRHAAREKEIADLGKRHGELKSRAAALEREQGSFTAERQQGQEERAELALQVDALLKEQRRLEGCLESSERARGDLESRLSKLEALHKGAQRTDPVRERIAILEVERDEAERRATEAAAELLRAESELVGVRERLAVFEPPSDRATRGRTTTAPVPVVKPPRR